MKASNLAIRPRARLICQFCDYALQQPAKHRRFLATSQFLATSARRQSRFAPKLYPTLFARNATTVSSRSQRDKEEENNLDHLIDISEVPDSEEQAAEASARAEELVDQILESTGVPDDGLVKAALSAIEETVRIRLDLITQSKTVSKATDSSPAGAILHLEKNNGRQKQQFDHLSQLAQGILEDPRVFISPSVLSAYVTIQSLLSRPSSFPSIFALYKSKAPAKSTSTSIEYSNPLNPNSAKQAIPAPVANLALDAAIKVKDLPLALEIIDGTFAHPSFHRAKTIQKAGVPLLGAAAFPFAAYILANQFSHIQDTMDESTATIVAFAGIMTYVTCTVTIGFVAISTANDQMDRVTWAKGTRLTERWLREEERAAVDRLAQAWGFKEVWKRGEEEGMEWESLREWTGIRGMVLDSTELMEGME